MRRDDVERFNRWAASYELSWIHRLFFARVHEGTLSVASRQLPHPHHILDVGCGTGALLRRAAQRFPEADLVGVDAASEMIKMARESSQADAALLFVRAHAEHLPFAEAEFDLVLSTASFHHWADQARGLREVSRVLSPGGLFVLADHFAFSWQRLIIAALRQRDRFHTRAEVEQLLAGAGFSVSGWDIVYRVGPLPLVAAVWSRKAPY